MNSSPRQPGPRTAIGARVAACAALLALSPVAAAASPDEPAGRVWLSIGALTGSTQPSAHLADYQWDTRLHPGFGAEALAGRGRIAAGLRVWSTQTTQTIDVSGASQSPVVRSTTVEAVTRARLLSWFDMPVFATASTGWLHMGYHPDQVTIPAGAGGPVVVDLKPIDEWTGGAGLAVAREVAAKWSLGVGIDYSLFRLDTAHRNGSGIVNSRESFGQWSARFEVARRFERR